MLACRGASAISSAALSELWLGAFCPDAAGGTKRVENTSTGPHFLQRKPKNMKPIRSAATFAAILLSMALGQAASAATYYVDSVKGTDEPNSTGGYSTPFKTISYTGKFVKPGDTVRLRGTGHFPHPTGIRGI